MRPFFYILIFNFFSMSAQDITSKNIVVTAIEQIIKNNPPSAAQALSLLSKVNGSLTFKQKILLPTRCSTIWGKANEFARQPDITTTSVIDQLIEWMKKEGYGDLSCIKDDMTQVAINPEPSETIVNLLSTKKQPHNFRVVGISGQDAWQHEEYIRKLTVQQKFNFHELCTLSLVSYSKVIKEKKEPIFNQECGAYKLDNYTYMGPEDINKPNEQYFKIFQNILKAEHLTYKNLLYIDGCETSLDTFQNVFSSSSQVCSFYKPDEQLIKQDPEAMDNLKNIIARSFKASY